VLRSFGFIALADTSICGAWAIAALSRVLRKSKRCAVVRLLFARPLWWLFAWSHSVPDAQTRYAEFRLKALAKWEDFLLGGDQ
jgi:hypothetical protein